MNLDKINASQYEFNETELGELLLQSVKQMKAGKIGRVHHFPLNTATEARQKTGLSQAEFAKVLGVSVRTLQSWEQGRREPSGAAATLLKIATRHPDTLMELQLA